MNLLIDFGNTNVKWSFVLDNKHLPSRSLKYSNSTPTELLSTIIKSAPLPINPTTIIIANVGKPDYVEKFCDLLISKYSSDLRLVQSSKRLLGVKSSYHNPTQLGVDRLLAMAAAYQQTNSAVIVVDIGTAVTLDCVEQSGQHLGGLIVPGSELMLKSLMSESSKLNVLTDENQNRISYSLLANNTHDAMVSGIHRMLASFIEDQVTVTLQTALIGQATSLFLTGGGSKAFRGEFGENWIYEPDLVLKGLNLILSAENIQ